jgi:hypothetical protein
MQKRQYMAGTDPNESTAFFSANDLKQCFPTISSAHPQAFDEIWAKAANALRDNMLVRLDLSHTS